MTYDIFLAEQGNHLSRNVPLHVHLNRPVTCSLGFFLPGFFGSTFSAFKAANG